MSYIIDDSILKEYDIRGVYNQNISEEDYYFIAKSFSTILIKNKIIEIVIGCDGRLSSPSLKKKLIQGFIESGINVIDIGIAPTPMVYFASHQLNTGAAMIVTGSHNPANYNGLKITLNNNPFYGEDIKLLGKISKKANFITGKGVIKKYNILPEYLDRLLQDSFISKKNSKIDKKLKIAWDIGNGAAAIVMKDLANNLMADNILLFADIDGNFPNHHPDPTVEKNLKDLKKTILEEQCDIGIAFDGDGDRIVIVDNEGETICGEHLIFLFAREILKENSNTTIIADIKASNILFDAINSLGGKALMWKTGHSLIKSKMKEINSLLAGEMSGHIFFADKYYGFDDALYASIRILNIIANTKLSLSSLKKEIPEIFSSPEIRIECDIEKKKSIIKNIKKELEDNHIKYNDIDGIRVDKDYGWYLIRSSNTQPVLVIKYGANSKKYLNIIENDCKTLISKYSLEF